MNINSSTVSFGYNNAQMKDFSLEEKKTQRKIYMKNVAGYLPIIGIAAGLHRIYVSVKPLSEAKLASPKQVFFAKQLVRGGLEALSLGIPLAIVDVALSSLRSSANKKDIIEQKNDLSNSHVFIQLVLDLKKFAGNFMETHSVP